MVPAGGMMSFGERSTGLFFPADIGNQSERPLSPSQEREREDFFLRPVED